jgi:hypothetical protein
MKKEEGEGGGGGGEREVHIPWYVMCNANSHALIADFLRSHSYWGLPEDDVGIFLQDSVPSFSPEGLSLSLFSLLSPSLLLSLISPQALFIFLRPHHCRRHQMGMAGCLKRS